YGDGRQLVHPNLLKCRFHVFVPTSTTRGSYQKSPDGQNFATRDGLPFSQEVRSMYDMRIPAGAHLEGHGDHPTARGATVQLADIRKEKPFRVLSEADWQHWITRGYVIVRNAAPKAQCDAVVDMLWEFEEMDRDDPSTWYRPQRRENKMRELNNA